MQVINRHASLAPAPGFCLTSCLNSSSRAQYMDKNYSLGTLSINSWTIGSCPQSVYSEFPQKDGQRDDDIAPSWNCYHEYQILALLPTSHSDSRMQKLRHYLNLGNFITCGCRSRTLRWERRLDFVSEGFHIWPNART